DGLRPAKRSHAGQDTLEDASAGSAAGAFEGRFCGLIALVVICHLRIHRRSWPARWMMHTRHCALSQGALPRYFALGLKKLKSALDFIPSMDKKSPCGGLRMDELIRVLRAFDALPPEKRGEVLAAFRALVESPGASKAHRAALVEPLPTVQEAPRRP